MVGFLSNQMVTNQYPLMFFLLIILMSNPVFSYFLFGECLFFHVQRPEVLVLLLLRPDKSTLR